MKGDDRARISCRVYLLLGPVSIQEATGLPNQLEPHIETKSHGVTQSTEVLYKYEKPRGYPIYWSPA